MFRLMGVLALACAAVLLSTVIAIAQYTDQYDGIQGQIRFGLALGLGMSGHKDLNDSIDGYERNFDEFIGYQDPGAVAYAEFEGDDLSGEPVLGLKMEYGVLDNVALGGELLLMRGNGGFDFRYMIDDYDYYMKETGDCTYEATGFIAGAYGVFITPLAGLPANLRIGGGFGFVHGVFDLSWESDYEYYDGGYYDWGRFSQGLKAEGHGVTLHLFGGLEYPLSDMFMIAAQAGYRYAGVGELYVQDSENYSYEQVIDGDKLLWDDSWGFNTYRGDEVGLNFGGLYIETVISAYF